MWREEEDATNLANEGLERGEDVAEIGTSVLFSGGSMVSLNMLGTEIWKLCEGRSREEIVAELLEAYEVDEDELRQDVDLFLDELTQKGFLCHEN